MMSLMVSSFVIYIILFLDSIYVICGLLCGILASIRDMIYESCYGFQQRRTTRGDYEIADDDILTTAETMGMSHSVRSRMERD